MKWPKQSNVCLHAWKLPIKVVIIFTWISNHMHGEVWEEISYPFLNFNGASVEDIGIDK